MPRLYIQVEIDIWEHPKVLGLVDAMGLAPEDSEIGVDLAVAFLERWWGWCVKYGSEGRPAVCPRTVLNGLAGKLLGRSRVSPKPEIEQLLRELRLMDRYGHAWDWEDFSGQLLTKRHKDAERKRTERGLSVDIPRNGARREEKSRTDSSLTLDLESLSSGELEAKTNLPMLPPRRGNSLADVQDHLRSIGEETRVRLLKRDARNLVAELVFSYSCKKLGHDKALLDEKRERAIVKALQGNHDDVSELLFVIDGAAADEWASVELKRNDVTVLFRDRSHIEKYLVTPKYRSGKPHPVAVRYGLAVDPSVNGGGANGNGAGHPE